MTGRRVWWVKYYRNGKPIYESSGSGEKSVAKRLLTQRLAAIDRHEPVTPDRYVYDDAVKDLVAYHASEGRDTKKVEGRIALHLTPYFQGRKMTSITGADRNAYVAHRQKEGATNATINRELAWLRQMFALANESGKLYFRPKIRLLTENNARQGFFEREQFEAICKHLPNELRPVAEFAYITGWRVNSEVLPLEWRQVDFKAGEVRLEVGTTKNKEGRVFPMTAALRTLLQAQHTEHERLKKRGKIEPHVFFRMIANGRGGPKSPKAIKSWLKAFKAACVAAGCPGRIPHDFRRTAVRNLVRAGIPERVAMTMTGHKTRSVFERYNIVAPTDLRDAVAKLDAAVG